MPAPISVGPTRFAYSPNRTFVAQARLRVPFQEPALRPSFGRNGTRVWRHSRSRAADQIIAVEDTKSRLRVRASRWRQRSSCRSGGHDGVTNVIRTLAALALITAS